MGAPVEPHSVDPTLAKGEHSPQAKLEINTRICPVLKSQLVQKHYTAILFVSREALSNTPSVGSQLGGDALRQGSP